jgi:hypothetical protein
MQFKQPCQNIYVLHDTILEIQIFTFNLTLSVLRPLAAIKLGQFSGNFTRVLIHAIKNSKGL